MDFKKAVVNVLTLLEAESRFKDLDPTLPRRGLSLSAYFTSDVVIFIESDVGDETIAMIDETDFCHVTFSNWPGSDNWINSFDLLLSEYFCNGRVLTTLEEFHVELEANKF